MNALAQPAPAPSRHHWHCEHCQAWVLPVRPHWGWRTAEVAFWLSIPVALMMMKFVGPVGIPFLLVYAGGLTGPLRSAAGAESLCPDCERFVFRAR